MGVEKLKCEEEDCSEVELLVVDSISHTVKSHNFTCNLTLTVIGKLL